MASKVPNGFTFIELLVVVVIIMVISGGVIVNYNSYNDSQKVQQATLTLKNNLRFAQSRATNGEKPDSGCSQLLGYRVTFTTNTYATQAQCTEGLVGVGTSVTLGSGLTVFPIPSPILFRVLSRGIDTDVTIKIVGSLRTYQVQVSRSGDMSEVTQTP